MVRSVGKEGQLKRWVVVSSDRLLCGQEGDTFIAPMDDSSLFSL